MSLYQETKASVDISEAVEVLSYTYEAEPSRSVLSRLQLGSASKPIAGNGLYVIILELNGIRISPDSSISVSSGVVATMAQSREILLRQGDELVVKVQGLVDDTDVFVETTLEDLTPLTESDLYGGGAVPVDHDYGEVDALRVVDDDGAGVIDVTITIYIKTDYEAGNRSHGYVKGRVTTDAHGRWRNVLSLTPETYTLVLAKPQVIETKIHELVVS